MSSNIFSSKRRLISLLLFVSLSLFLIGCHQGKFDPFDRSTGLTKKEIKDSLITNKSSNYKKYDLNKSKIPVPRSSRLLAVPPPPKVGGDKLISFSATDDIPLKDILIELGRVTKIDIDIDPSITGGVIINATRRPLKEVLDRISDMADLRYSFTNNMLHFERDLPYPKHYLVDYLIDGELWTAVETNLTNIIAEGGSEDASSSLSSNKSAGIITVFANEKQHLEVRKYLKKVEINASAQVLIEAKVVEVTLNDNFKSGIVWNFLDDSTSVGSNTGSVDSNPFSVALAGNGILGGDLSVTLNALEEFGTVRAISSPRISALNNQSASLNFVDKLVYFTIEVEDEDTAATGSSTQSTTITATKNEEPVGVELDITPSINLTTNEITLNVNPRLSVHSDDAIDPSVNPSTGESLGNTIPIIQTRELNTTMKVQSGGTLVIGGLMKEDTSSNDRGVPFLNRIPILGYFFKSTNRSTKVVETVIFIKATIVNSGSGVDKHDRDFHNKFTTQPKPYLK
jgi:MSHA type pilus biogenesis protein MshL